MAALNSRRKPSRRRMRGNLVRQPDRSATGACVATPALSELPQDASLPRARTGRRSAHSAPPPLTALMRRTHPTFRPKPLRSKRASPALRTSPRSGGTGARLPRSSARVQPPSQDRRTACSGTADVTKPTAPVGFVDRDGSRSSARSRVRLAREEALRGSAWLWNAA